GLEEAEICVRRRDVRVLRVQHQRYAQRLEAAAGKFRTRTGCAGRQRIAEHVRESYASLFEEPAVDHYAARSAAPCFALPVVRAERLLSVDCLERGNDPHLQALQIISDSRNRTIAVVHLLLCRPQPGGRRTLPLA